MERHLRMYELKDIKHPSDHDIHIAKPGGPGTENRAKYQCTTAAQLWERKFLH